MEMKKSLSTPENETAAAAITASMSMRAGVAKVSGSCSNSQVNHMKTSALLLALALSASTCSLVAQDDGTLPPPRGAGPGTGGPFMLPPPVHKQLNLTADQEKQLAELRAEFKAKFESVLTPEQLQKLQAARPRRDGQGAGAPAAANQDPSQGPPRGMGGPRHNPVIEALDVDHDGVLDAEEIAKAPESLKALDKNNDGQLTPDELRPMRLAGVGPNGPQGMFRRGGPGGPRGQAPEELPPAPAPEQ
jgi:hypothetical protein